MSRSRSHIWKLTLLGLCVITLTACDTGLFQGPMAVRKSGDTLEVAVCQRISVLKATAQERVGWGPFSRWETFWSATGELTLEPGESLWISADQGPLNSTEFRAPDLSGQHELDIYLTDALGADISAVFSVSERQLATGDWVLPNGDVAEVPCESTP